MGADWYTCLTYFGYGIKVPDGMTYKKFVNKVNEINEFLQEPYKITGLLERFHSRMESASDYDLQTFDEGATILIGFKPTAELTMLTHNINELKEYVTDNHYLMGLELSETPMFYSGIEWFTNMYYEYESSDEEEEEDYDEEEEEEEEYDEDQESDEECSSDEDETKIAPEPEKSQ
jgi:hypothetical protein